MITETRNRHRRDEGADGSLATEQNSQVLTSLKPGEGLFHQTAKLMLKKMLKTTDLFQLPSSN